MVALMLTPVSLSSFDNEAFNARENRAWKYFNIPWALQGAGMNATSRTTDANAFESALIFPPGQYLTEDIDELQGSMLTRYTFRQVLPFSAKRGERIRLRHAFEWDLRQHMTSKHSSYSKLLYNIGFQTSWRLYGAPGPDHNSATPTDHWIALEKGGETLCSLSTVASEDNDYKHSNQNFPRAPHEFVANTWSLDRPVEHVVLWISFWLNIGIDLQGDLKNWEGDLPGHEHHAVIANALLKSISLENYVDPSDQETNA